MNPETECKYLFKIILIGNSGVGKTCLMRRFTDETYEFNQTSTIGVDFKIKTVTIDSNKIKLQIWDTAGQERFRAIISNYYRGAHGIIIVFDMTNKESFENLSEWISEIKKNTNEKIEVVLLGNKVDKNEKICVQDEDVYKFMDEHDIPREVFIKTSAKDDIRVTEGFECLTRRLVKKFESGGYSTSKKDGFRLRSGEPDGGKCCM